METTNRLLLEPTEGQPRVARTAARLLGRPLNRLLGLDELDALYGETRRAHGTAHGGAVSNDRDASRGAAFLDQALAKLQVDTHVAPSLDGVPATGPLVVVANHPYGGIEGLALVRELMRVRPDVKVMANRLLSRVVELDAFSIWVNPFGGAAAQKSNIGAMRDALGYVKAGGALLVFPAGEVSHLKARAKFDWSVLDPAWQPSIARLIMKSGATVLPMHIEGRNSNLFQLAGLISPILRTALLPRELLGRRRSTLRARVGRPIAPEQWARYDDPEKLIKFLRLATYALSGTCGPEGGPGGGFAALAADEPEAKSLGDVRRAFEATSSDTREPVAAAADPADVEAEIRALPAGRQLHASGPLEVHYAYASEIPTVMHELGRLREATFRAVGEGTGRPLDLDAYDDHYRHLFLWHRTERRIVGAYRLGATDDILATSGELGLYTRSLFRYSARFVKDLGPAIELGRAFVVKDFQKSYLPLMLLWQGIGRFLVAHPRYVTLFGPVSISADYSPVSRYVMARRLLSATGGPRAQREVEGEPAAKVKRFAKHLADPFESTRRRLPFGSKSIRSSSSSQSRRFPFKSPDNPTGNYRVDNKSVAGVDLETLESLAKSSNDLCQLIANIDPTGQGLPVLLRQYLKLNGRVLAFNLDRAFGDSLDALLVVDLRDTEPRDLKRILGAEGYEVFVQHHGVPGSAEGEPV